MTVGLLLGANPPAPMGWTTVNPVGTPQTPSGVGAGSRQIYVANASSGGSDANAGTQASPFKTIQFACNSIRSGKSDQLFLACGDTFDLSDAGGDQGFYNNVLAGFSAGPVRTAANENSDLTTSGPILIGSYQKPAAISTARPVVRWSLASTTNNNCMGSDGGHVFDNVIVQGIEFYAYKRDPNNIAFSAAEAWPTSPGGVFCGGAVTYNLFEDCNFRFFFQNAAYQTSNNMPNNAVNFNRCILTDAYASGNAVGIFISVAGSLGGYNPNVWNITNCLFDQNGWNQTLMIPQSVTVASGTTFNWPVTPPFVNGCLIYPMTSSGNFNAATGYVVLNLVGSTFSLAAQGAPGTPLSTAGSASPRNMQWGDTRASILKRNVYIDPPGTFLNNLSFNSSSDWGLFRQGGTIQKNVGGLSTGSNFGDIIDGFANISTFDIGWNWTVNSVDLQDIPVAPRSGGMQINNTTGAGSSANLHDNIITHGLGPSTTVAWGIMLDNNSGIGTGGCVGVTVKNNIVFDWGKGYQDLGTGTINTGNTIDPTASNTLGVAPEPFPAGRTNNVQSYSTSIGGAGTIADFLAKARLNSRLGGYDFRYTANPLLNHGLNGLGLASV